MCKFCNDTLRVEGKRDVSFHSLRGTSALDQARFGQRKLDQLFDEMTFEKGLSA